MREYMMNSIFGSRAMPDKEKQSVIDRFQKLTESNNNLKPINIAINGLKKYQFSWLTIDDRFYNLKDLLDIVDEAIKKQDVKPLIDGFNEIAKQINGEKEISKKINNSLLRNLEKIIFELSFDKRVQQGLKDIKKQNDFSTRIKCLNELAEIWEAFSEYLDKENGKEIFSARGVCYEAEANKLLKNNDAKQELSKCREYAELGILDFKKAKIIDFSYANIAEGHINELLKTEQSANDKLLKLNDPISLFLQGVKEANSGENKKAIDYFDATIKSSGASKDLKEIATYNKQAIQYLDKCGQKRNNENESDLGIYWISYYEFAMLSYAVYVPDKINSQKVKDNIDIAEMKWSIFLTSSEDANDTFFAMAFINDDKQKVIIAYRGTVNDENLLTDGRLALQLQDKMFSMAYHFSYDVENKLQKNGKNSYEKFYTGHSLGAALAEVVACEDGYKQAVTFDSPGTYPFIESPANANIICFSNTPNLVNTAQKHAGKIIKVLPIIQIDNEVQREALKIKLNNILTSNLLPIPLIKYVKKISILDILEYFPNDIKKLFSQHPTAIQDAYLKTALSTHLIENFYHLFKAELKSHINIYREKVEKWPEGPLNYLQYLLFIEKDKFIVSPYSSEMERNYLYTLEKVCHYQTEKSPLIKGNQSKIKLSPCSEKTYFWDKKEDKRLLTSEEVICEALRSRL